MELLDANIDVVTTVNIQHLESIGDAVEAMTGANVRERVPDWVVHRADQIELVDSSPEQLRRRMLHGNIYLPAKVPQALAEFFRRENLIALRELALRFLADEAEESLLEFLQQHQATGTWETTERIMVAVTGAPGTDVIVRRAARMSARIKAELHVVHIVDGDGRAEDPQIAALRQLASDLAARWEEIRAHDVSRALLEFAARAQITQIVIGSSRHSRWQELLRGGSVVRRIERLARVAGIDVHIIARRDGVSKEMLDPDRSN
jgi:two-component system sensor histidine kinase KdpD